MGLHLGAIFDGANVEGRFFRQEEFLKLVSDPSIPGALSVILRRGVGCFGFRVGRVEGVPMACQEICQTLGGDLGASGWAVVLMKKQMFLEFLGCFWIFLYVFFVGTPGFCFFGIWLIFSFFSWASSGNLSIFSERMVVDSPMVLRFYLELFGCSLGS